MRRLIVFKNRYGEIRSGWAIALSLLALTMAQMIVGIIVGIYIVITVGLGDIQRYMEAVIGASSGNLVLLMSNLLTIGAALLLFKLLYKRPFKCMGLSSKKALRELIYGCLFGIASISFVFAVLLISGQAKIENVNLSVVFTSSFIMSLIAFIMVGFGEEILTRGFMMTALKTTRNKIVILTGTSVIFSLMHLFNPNTTFLSLVNIFLVGLLFAYLFVKTGKLWWPIGYHITWNFFQGNIFGMNVSGIKTLKLIDSRFVGAEWITGGAFGAEGGIVVTLVIVLGLLFIRYGIKTPENREWTMESDLPLTRTAAVISEQTEESGE